MYLSAPFRHMLHINFYFFLGNIWVPVPVINILTEDANSSADSSITLVANSSAFGNITPSENPGQLYSYFISNSSAVLATRSAIYMAENETSLPIVVGISSVADGMYCCKVTNFVVTNNKTITITASEG